MFRRITSFLIFLFLLSITPGLHAASEYVAVVIKSRGQVTLIPKGKTRAIKVQKGQLLRDGDRLETGTASFCAIKFLDDKSLLRIKENSTCVIEGKKEGDKIDKNILVEVGSFFASIFKQRGKFLVTTPTSVASVKGTQFWTIQKRNGPTIYIGIEGSIDISNEAGRVLLRAGQTGIVTSKNQLPQIRLTDPSEIPSEGEGSIKTQILEIEFQSPDGAQKTMRIEVIQK